MNSRIAFLVCALAIPLTTFPAASKIPEPTPAADAAAPPAALGGKLSLVEDGQPRAEIVISPERPRMVTLAALELRHFLEKITGAKLPIVTEPATENPVKIYVGSSAGTDKLGITAEGLKYGAYKIVSGPDWLVLLGEDFDYDPSKFSVPMRRNDEAGLKKWQEATKDKTDSEWGYPLGSGFKKFWNPANFLEVLTNNYGEDAQVLWDSVEGERPGMWEHDRGGSLNAVYGFLGSLGARWYMAGELGEVLPNKTANLVVGPFNETVVPDYALRTYTWYNYGSFGFDDVIWARRLGINCENELLGPVAGPHGLVNVHKSKAMQTAHPEYYALIGDKRDTGHRGYGTPCFTSQGMINETVNYIRFVFDTYEVPSFDIWPVDGLKVCQCEDCEGKSASELVWGFADKVAREVYKTHPDKLITNGAYTSYKVAPDSIEKFSPNLAVWLTNFGRPRMTDDQHWNEYWANVQKWQGKMAPGNILRTENNRYHIFGISEGEDGRQVRGEPIAYPVIHPRAVARDLKALKGISRAETGEQSQFRGKWKRPGLEHITLYVHSRFLWDADLDVDEVLNEYCEQFYGPAAGQMKEFIDFAEANLAHKDESRGGGRGDPRNVSLKTALKLRDLLDVAKAAAGDTIYGRRVQAVIDDLQPRKDVIAAYQAKETDLAKARAKAPLAKAVAGADLSEAPPYTLGARRISEVPSVATTFKLGWDQDALLMEILCKEPEMQNLKVSENITGGDYVAVSIETPNHSYYHIEINPDGKVVEGNPTSGWQSLAEVKTEKGPDFWLVKLRIPVVGDEEAAADPNHRVAGAKPTSEAPWFFNVGRIRMLDGESPETQIFSPTGGSWHVPPRFGKLEVQ